MIDSRLLWIGDRRHAEMRQPFEWARMTKRCHYRPDIVAAAKEPAPFVTRVIIARPDRQPQDPGFDQLLTRYPLARFATLRGSLCEGECRTGSSWAACTNILWYRWDDELPAWMSDRPEAQDHARTSLGLIGIVVRNPAIGEGLRDSLMHLGLATMLVDPNLLPSAGPWRHLLWDDSIIWDVDAWQRIPAKTREALPGTPKHHWLASAPRVKDWNRLQESGIAFVHGKPFRLHAMLRTLQS